MHGTLYLAQIGSIASCTPLVYAPKMAFTPSSVTSRDVASAPVAGSLLQSCTISSTLYFLSPMDSPPLLFTVSAQSWYPRWAICPPVADAPDSSSTAPTLNVSVASPPPVSPPHAAEEARAGNHAAHHEAGPGEKESTVDVVGHDHSSRVALAGRGPRPCIVQRPPR